MDLLKARLPLAVVVSVILSVGGLALGAGRALAENSARVADQQSRIETLEKSTAEMRDMLIEIKTSEHDARDRLIRVERKIDEMQRGR